MSFGFSASDFVTFGKLILDVTTALQDAGGAKSEYQGLVRELESLNAVLRHLDKLDCNTQTASQTVLSIKYAALSCRHPLEVFLAKVQKYRRSLGVWSRSSTIKTTTDKLRWSFGHADEARRLQVFLNVHISTLNILLAEHGFERMDLSDRKSDAYAQAAHDQLEKTNEAISYIRKDLKGQALMVRSVQSMLSSLYTLVCGDMRTSLQHFSNVVNGVCVRTQQIYNVVIQVRDSLATLDTRWTHFQECIRVEDALGLPFAVPSECDYSMLTTIIHRRFDSGPGAADVYAGNYELYITNKRADLVTLQTKLSPGVAMTMAIIISTGRRSEMQCPMTQCGSSKVAACPGGVLLCKECGVKFDRANKKRRRFEEFDEEDVNVAESTGSHCTTCTCCRPSKRPKSRRVDVEEQRAIFKNVRWALDEDMRQSPTRARRNGLLEHLDFQILGWNAPASSDYVNFGMELIGAPLQHPSEADADNSQLRDWRSESLNNELWTFPVAPSFLPALSPYYNEPLLGPHLGDNEHDSFLPRDPGSVSPLTAFNHSDLSYSWHQQASHSFLPQKGFHGHLSSTIQTPSIRVTGTAGGDLAPPQQEFAAFNSIYPYQPQATLLQLNTNFNNLPYSKGSRLSPDALSSQIPRIRVQHE